MEMRSSYVNRSGQRLETLYTDIESEKEIDMQLLFAVQAFCFCEGKLVIVYSEQKGYWGPPGGGVEAGESARAATVREVLEESNMRVLTFQLLGMLTVFEPGRTKVHVRSVCIVAPIGPFIMDPDGDVTEIKLIEPEEYRKYFDWEEVGEYQFRKALSMLSEFDVSQT